MSDLQNRLADAEARLRAALLAGQSTGALRQEITHIREDIARHGQAEERHRHEQAEAERQIVIDRAALIAADATARIDNRLAALQAPEHP